MVWKRPLVLVPNTTGGGCSAVVLNILPVLISFSPSCPQKEKKTVVSAGPGLAGLSCELWRMQG